MDPTYEILLELRERMVRFETKLDNHAERHTEVRREVESQDQRLSKLEGNFKVAASIGGIAIFMATFFQGPITTALGM